MSARRRPQEAKWVNTRIRSSAAKTDSTISSRRASLPGSSLEWSPVVAVGGRVVADLLERGDGGEDRSLLRLTDSGLVGDVGDELVEHGLVEPDLLGGHRAVVELVDLVGELGCDLRLVLGASEQQDPVQCSQGGLAVARQLGDERRSGADEARVGEVQDGPQIAEPVLDRCAGEREAGPGGIRRSCWAVSLVGFLIACASSSTTVPQRTRRARRCRGRRWRRW